MNGARATGQVEGLRLFTRGALSELDAATKARLLERGHSRSAEVEVAVTAVIRQVMEDGDAALHELAVRFGGRPGNAEGFEIPAARVREALYNLDSSLRSALEEAAAAIEEFHRAQLPQPMRVEARSGVLLERRPVPLLRVGVYAPGGSASYPSSVLMGAVPAKLAGVSEVIVCSPPGPDGLPSPALLAACAVAGVDRVFALGGPAAVAAMALGTESVPRVDKVVGPGNAYVAEAKRQLAGTVATDAPAGPSEVLVVADETAPPRLVALELLAQAEHDPNAAVVAITLSAGHASAVLAELERELKDTPRREVAARALAGQGAVLNAATLEGALAFADDYAPEHLLLAVADPRSAAERVRNAGTVLLGTSSSVAFGDYATGANHVLPTAGRARAYSGLGTADFLRFVTIQEVAPAAAAQLAKTAVVLAEAEGLPAHAAAARARDAVGVVASPKQGFGALTRAAYRELKTYNPGRRRAGSSGPAQVAEVDLSDNTNLFGVNPAALTAVRELTASELTRYPDVYSQGLKELLAELHRVAPENIVTGCGLDDVIDSAVRAFSVPGDTLAFPDPTFGMVADFGRMNGVTPVPVPLGEGFELQPEALVRAGAKLTYLCNPNNPSGTLWDDAQVEEVAAGVRGVLLLDAAYADYAPGGTERAFSSVTRWLGHPVLTLRTFSKAFGLAGLRAGYAVGPAELIAEVEKSRGPYKVTAAADAAARAVLARGLDWVREVVSGTVENRERLRSELLRMGLNPQPSATNFLLFPAPSGTAARLLRQGVAVREFADLPRYGSALRVTVGPWELMERFLGALVPALEGTQ